MYCLECQGTIGPGGSLNRRDISTAIRSTLLCRPQLSRSDPVWLEGIYIRTEPSGEGHYIEDRAIRKHQWALKDDEKSRYSQGL